MKNNSNEKNHKKETPKERKERLEQQYIEDKRFIERQAKIKLHMNDYVKQVISFEESVKIKETITKMQQDNFIREEEIKDMELIIAKYKEFLNFPTLSDPQRQQYTGELRKKEQIKENYLEEIKQNKEKVEHYELLLEYAYVEPSKEEMKALQIEINEMFDEIDQIPELKIVPFMLPKEYWRKPLKLSDVLPMVKTNDFWCRQNEIAFPTFNAMDELPDKQMIPPYDLYELSATKLDNPKPPYGTMKVVYELGLFERITGEMRYVRAKTARGNKKEYVFIYVWDHEINDVDDLTGQETTYCANTWLPIRTKNKEDQKLWEEREKDDVLRVEKMNIFSLHFLQYLKKFEDQLTKALASRSIPLRIAAFQEVERYVDYANTYLQILQFKGLLTEIERKAIQKLHESRIKFAKEGVTFLLSERNKGLIEPMKESEYEYTNDKDVLTRLKDEDHVYKGKAILEVVDDNLETIIEVRPEKVKIDSTLIKEQEDLVKGTFGADENERIVFHTLPEVERLRYLSKESRKQSEEEAILDAQIRHWRKVQKERKLKKRAD